MASVAAVPGADRGKVEGRMKNAECRSRSRRGSGWRETVGGVVQFICRLKAAFLARRLQAAVAAGAAVAAVPGGGLGNAEGRRQNVEGKGRFAGWWRSAGALSERALSNFSLRGAAHGHWGGMQKAEGRRRAREAAISVYER